MLLTTKRTNRESKSNDCRKQKAATTPLTEGSKRKALKVREWACRADSQLWGGWCSAGACVYELWRRQSEGSVPGFWRQGMAAAEDKTFFCHYRDERLCCLYMGPLYQKLFRSASALIWKWVQEVCSFKFCPNFLLILLSSTPWNSEVVDDFWELELLF